MAITISNPDLDLVSQIYTTLHDNGAPPDLMPQVAIILADRTALWRECILLGSIPLGMALATVGLLANSPIVLLCAALAFFVTAVAYILWEVL